MTRVYIDAAAGTNPKAAAGAVVFKDDAGQKEFTAYLGEMDNHEAEWAVLEFAVDKALEHGYRSLIIHTDSKVIADSFDKNHVKNKVFRKYFMSVSDKLGEMALFIISWTPRNKNRHADALAKDALFRHRKN